MTKTKEQETEQPIAPIEDIHDAIAYVMAEVGYVQKKKGGEGLKYAYAGEAALIEALRPPMVEAGITFHCIGIVNHQRECVRQKKLNNGKEYESTSYFTTGLFTFRFTHAASGSFIDVMALGEGYDSLDKGAYKAMTGALKYALRQTFIIETGDDPDKYQEEPQPVQKAQQLPDLSQGLHTYVQRLGVHATIAELEEFHKQTGVIKFLKDAEAQPDVLGKANTARALAEKRIGATELNDEVPF